MIRLAIIVRDSKFISDQSSAATVMFPTSLPSAEKRICKGQQHYSTYNAPHEQGRINA